MHSIGTVEEIAPWGIESFDQFYGGIPGKIFNLLRACNSEVSIVSVGHFLRTGIELDQRVTLVCFDHPSYLLARLNGLGFSFDDEIISEQFIYLHYKPDFSHSLSLLSNYWQMFSEVRKLSRDSARIAFLNADVMFNLETYLLAEASAERIMTSFDCPDCVVLGCYQAADTSGHRHLDEVARILLSSYMEIKPAKNADERRYEMIVHKSPLFESQESISLSMKPGTGFNTPNIELITHG